jgi:hypothetical protein
VSPVIPGRTLYDSLRRRTGSNVMAHRPRNITDIVQTDHLRLR